MKDKLFTTDYFLIVAANFMQGFGFWLILPVLPFYLSEVFGASNATIGMVLSCYIVAALSIRPFSGFLLDTLARKPLYLIAYFIFTAMFAGYILAGTLTLFVTLRVIHGLSFGMETVGGNTIVIDIMPSSRRGEGLGYFGLSNNIAMATGPMTGLFMHEAGLSFTTIFVSSAITCILGFICAICVHTPYKPPQKRPPISLDRFILLKGIPGGLCLLLMAIPYGMTTNYIAMYAQQIDLQVQSGFFFTLMAIGMAVSRIFSGKLVDKGRVTQVIAVGLHIAILAFILLTCCKFVAAYDRDWGRIVFFTVAPLLGIGFGQIFPAYNALFVNLAPNNQRGTATSTYLTSWDVGIAGGMMLGGFISNMSNFCLAYLTGTFLVTASTLYFLVKVGPHFNKYKLR